MVEQGHNDLLNTVVLLSAAVIAVPLFKRLGLGSVLGYLAAGLAIGPFGLALFTDSRAILHIAELGVVMFLFIIGLEMRPSHLWSLRRQIFGLGALQIFVCSAAMTCVGLLFGFSLPVSFISASGFVLTSTAIVMQLLGERGDINQPRGQQMVSILLFEDLLIVPLLAVVALMAPGESLPMESRWLAVGIAGASLAGLIAAGIWLLNPLFRILANAHAREVMTAAALLVVLGSALLMQLGGLSMAMGAFVAGVLLSESTFRHQLEADIEPFRGILLGLFFLGVGMALDLAVVQDNLGLIVAGVIAMMLAKGISIYVVARLTHSSHADALDRATLMAQGGEFAFVLYAAATAAGVIDAQVNANMTAIVVLSMALTPLVVIVLHRFVKPAAESLDGVEAANGQSGSVLIIGFGRFGQIASQSVLAYGCSTTILDTNTRAIRDAADFGFKVYYGDGRRPEVLHAAGAATASVVLVCLEDKAAALSITELLKKEFPLTKVLVRAHDREHALALMEAGADFQIRETFESAMLLGKEALRAMNLEDSEVERITADVRRRDNERFALEACGGLDAGKTMLLGNIESRHATEEK